MKLQHKLFLHPFYPILIIFLILQLTLYFLSLRHTQGQFYYALDDAYIHMAMAKNFSIHGTWGITQDEFTSSSSSILWTLIVSGGFFLFNVHSIIPFIFNLILGCLLLLLSFKIWKNSKSEILMIWVFSSFLILATPLHALIFSGMEHVLHLFLSLTFIHLVASHMDISKKKNFHFSFLVLVTFFLTLTRYESLFLIFSSMIILLRKKDFRTFYAITGATIIPIFAYGFLSRSQGWFFFPNSVLLKSDYLHHPSLTQMVQMWVVGYQQLFRTSGLREIFIVCCFVFFGIASMPKYQKNCLQLWLLTTLFHVVFSKVGWFFRYEAYLVGTGIVLLGSAAGFLTTEVSLSKYRACLESRSKKLKTREKERYVQVYFERIRPTIFGFCRDSRQAPRKLALTTMILFGISLLDRMIPSIVSTPKASRNIFEQQIQIASMIHTFTEKPRIALHDIGAVHYMNEVHSVDLFGLANMDIAKAKINMNYNFAFLDKMLEEQNIELLIFYESWLTPFGKIPDNWIKMGDWRIAENVVCSDSTVSFYVRGKGNVEKYYSIFHQYSMNKLPKTVQFKD